MCGIWGEEKRGREKEGENWIEEGRENEFKDVLRALGISKHNKGWTEHPSVGPRGHWQMCWFTEGEEMVRFMVKGVRASGHSPGLSSVPALSQN